MHPRPLAFLLPTVFLAVAGFGLFPVPTARAADEIPPELKYRVLRGIPLEGETGWDYLVASGETRRLFVTRGTHVSVLNADTGEVVGKIADLPGVHGVALAPALGRGFTSNGRDDSMTIFDLKTLATIGKLKTGANPDAIIYEPVTRRVFVFNGRSKDATVTDAERDTVLGTFPVGGKPEFAAVDGAGMVYVNVEDTNEVLAIDAKSMTIKSRWPLAPGTDPTGLAIDPKSRRLFVGCGNKKLVVLNADNGKVLTTLDIGAGVDAVEFDQMAGGIFTSNGADGTLTVVQMESPEKFRVVDTVPTQKGGRTMAFDVWTRHIFIMTAKYGPPPAPTKEQPNPRAAILAGSVNLLELAPQAEVR